MKNKIDITINIPSLGKDFDFIVPANIAVKEGITLILRMVKEEYKEITCEIGQLQLFDISESRFINKEKIFKAENIYNGSKLILL